MSKLINFLVLAVTVIGPLTSVGQSIGDNDPSGVIVFANKNGETITKALMSERTTMWTVEHASNKLNDSITDIWLPPGCHIEIYEKWNLDISGWTKILYNYSGKGKWVKLGGKYRSTVSSMKLLKMRNWVLPGYDPVTRING